MTEDTQILLMLQRIEHNQQQALAMQAEQLKLLRAQMERTQSQVSESIELQRLAVRRQARALFMILPLILLAVTAAGLLLLRVF